MFDPPQVSFSVRRKLVVILVFVAALAGIATAQQNNPVTPSRPSWLNEEIQAYKGIAEDARRNSSDAMAATREAIFFCVFVTLAFLGFGFYTLRRMSLGTSERRNFGNTELQNFRTSELPNGATSELRQLEEMTEHIRATAAQLYRFMGDSLLNQAHSGNEVQGLFSMLGALDAYHMAGAEDAAQKTLGLI